MSGDFSTRSTRYRNTTHAFMVIRNACVIVYIRGQNQGRIMVYTYIYMYIHKTQRIMYYF